MKCTFDEMIIRLNVIPWNKPLLAGFRSDASKHIWPKDLKAILDSVHNLNTQYFPANSRPFVFHEAYPSQSPNGVGIVNTWLSVEFWAFKPCGTCRVCSANRTINCWSFWRILANSGIYRRVTMWSLWWTVMTGRGTATRLTSDRTSSSRL